MVRSFRFNAVFLMLCYVVVIVQRDTVAHN